MFDFTIRRKELVSELNRRQAEKAAAHRAKLRWAEGTPMRRRLALTVRELEQERRQAFREVVAAGRPAPDATAPAIALSDAL